MKKLIISIALILSVQNGLAEMFIWYDENGTKHVSTIPRECITESNTVAFMCINDIPAGDPEVIAELRQQRQIEENNWSECGEPGKVYIGEELATNYMKNLLDNGGLISAMVVQRIGPTVVKADEKAKQTCEDVVLRFQQP